MSSTPIRFAIIGCGGAGGFRVRPVLQRDDVEVVALCDVSEERTRAYAERNLADTRHRPRHVCALDELFAPGDIDAVVIASPHTLHFPQAMAAIEAGADVYVEKPMVTETAHAIALRDALRRGGRKMVVGYNAPCSPAFARLRRIIRDRELGTLDLFSGYLSQDWLTLVRGSWRQDPALSGGGQLYDSGCHLLAGLLWAVDEPVEEVFAMVKRYDAPVDITSALAIRFAGGALASVGVVGNSPNWGQHGSYCFSGGRVDLDAWGGSWLKVLGPKEELEAIDRDGYRTPLEHFIEVVRGREETLCGVEHGIRHSQLMDAIYESERRAAPVRPAEMGAEAQEV